MGITERLANLSIPTVIITMVVLFLIRYVLRKQDAPFAKQAAELAESLAVAMGLVFLIIRPFIVQAFFIPSPSMVPTLLEHDHILVNKFIYRFKEPQRGDVIVFKSPPEADREHGIERDFIKRVIAGPGEVVRITPGYVIVGDSTYERRDVAGALGASSAMVKLADGGILVDGRTVTPEEVAAAVGQPGARVKIVPGRVYINSKPLKEPYIAEDPEDPYPPETPDNRYSVLPDRWTVKDGSGHLAVKIPEGKLLVVGDNRNASHDARFWGLLDRDRVLGKAMFIFWPPGRVRLLH